MFSTLNNIGSDLTILRIVTSGITEVTTGESLASRGAVYNISSRAAEQAYRTQTKGTHFLLQLCQFGALLLVGLSQFDDGELQFIQKLFLQGQTSQETAEVLFSPLQLTHNV